MGSKYTVEAGIGNEIVFYYGTECFIKALVVLFKVKVDRKDIYWKSLKVI